MYGVWGWDVRDLCVGVLVLVFMVERIMQIILLVERNSNDIDRLYKMLNGQILSIGFFLDLRIHKRINLCA